MRQPARIVVQIGPFNLGSQGFCIIASLISNQKQSFSKEFFLFYEEKKQYYTCRSYLGLKFSWQYNETASRLAGNRVSQKY